MRPRSAARPTVALAVSVAVAVLLAAAAIATAAPGTRTITFADLMKFRAIEKPVIAEDGSVVAYGLQPDRGDGEGIVRVLAGGRTIRVGRGGSPIISKNARWVAMAVKPTLAATEKAGKEKPKPGLAIVDVAAGTVTTFENVERYVFSDDSRWVAYLIAAPDRPADAARPATAAQPEPPLNGRPAAAKKPAGTLKLRDLASGRDLEIQSVAAYAFDPASRYLAYAVAAPEGAGNGLYLKALADPGAAPAAATRSDRSGYDNLAWSRDGANLAFSSIENADTTEGPATIWTWQPGRPQAVALVTAAQAPDGWMVPFKNELTWSKDGRDLYFGFRPDGGKAALRLPQSGPDGTAQGQGAEAAADLFDFDAIRSKAEVDVWHWNDPRIIPQQKMLWDREKDRIYRAVARFRPDTGLSIVPLASRAVPDVAVPDNGRVALGTSDAPYLRETTWGERYRDVYVVDLDSGKPARVASRLRGQASLSPDGRVVAFYDEAQWRFYEVSTGATRSATAAIPFPLFDEEHDTPDTPPAYGFGGWVDEGTAALVYDRYDIWKVSAAGGAPVNLTAGEGRRRGIRFRAIALDPEAKSFSSRQPMLLTAYHDREKNWGFYAASLVKPGVELRVDEKKVFRFVAKAKSADTVLYTREDFGEFPDVWAAGSSFRQPVKITDANPQLAEFAWGTAELVEYKSQDGVPLQGVLIKPANYQPGRRYPVITYFYERQSQRLYEFNEPVVNHRPSFPVYAGAGYAVFLPDIVFTEGHPGPSIVKCLVPAVQKLVEMGVADPKALGLHGHSWGGYGTAYVVTQTDMFGAAVTGAPVANMTSAYGGIRWESGLARQFQYEQSQSRIGGSLWERRDLYIENSALFFADRIKTPLLIEHGDEDGAVPWYQGIELYLALRRLGKDCVFLQYRGEPHHLRKYPNKLDYSIRMMEYFDHYLKGAPAADWITKGVEYRGK